MTKWMSSVNKVLYSISIVDFQFITYYAKDADFDTNSNLSGCIGAVLNGEVPFVGLNRFKLRNDY